MFVIATNDKQEHFADFMAWQLREYPLVAVSIDSWYEKPDVLLSLPHDKLIWLDNDIYIKDERFFQILKCPGLAAAWDNVANNYNTGVLVVEDRAPIKVWKDQMDRSKHGDQDSFPGHLVKYKLDSCYNSLRLSRAKLEYAIHYTGPVGKKLLEEKIDEVFPT